MSTRAAIAHPPSLEADWHEVRLGKHLVLKSGRVSFKPGRWTAIVGPNGAGKSTLLRTLAGLQPCDGEVRLQGRAMRHWPAKARACELAWLGQAEQGGEDLRADDVVMLGRLPHQGWLAAPSPQDHAAVESAMRCTQSWAWRERPLGQLSGGERQRVLLARALAVQARVILMDEPLSHLDPPHQADWLGIVRAMCAQGVTVVSVLHELNMALHADDLIVMSAGELRYQGPAHGHEAHRGLMDVFERRIRLHEVGGEWVALPCGPDGTDATACAVRPSGPANNGRDEG